MAAAPIKHLGELPAVFTVADLRQALNISLPKAYELAHRQDFPKLRVGRAIRIPRDAFIRWLETGSAKEAV
jgi:excisionase family DNA binding protein